jgi:hypothetical protein
MNQGHPGQNRDNTGQAIAARDEDLAVIREQTRETLALLRQLIEMLLPKGDPDAPKLEDLIAALVAQQREMLLLLKHLASDMSDLLDHAAVDGRPKAQGGHAGSGAASR